jgi:teichuronic acid biosynthesis glycosyltransferase TuaC
MTVTIRVLMITSKWPTADQPYTTPFIKRQVDFLRAAGIDVEVFHFESRKNPLNYLRAWRQAQRLIARRSYDLIHAQFGQSGLLGLPKRIPLVVTFRGSDLLGVIGGRNGSHTLRGKIAQMISRMVARHADAVILVAEHMKRHLNKAVPVHVIPSGIDFDLFRCIPQNVARKKLGLPLHERLVLFVGSSDRPGKRFEVSSRAVDILNRSLSARLIVASNVDHADIPIYMNACDALLFSSVQEGSPNVIKEALACNLPIVSVPVGDVALRIGQIEGCELCADDCPESVAAALERVLRKEQRIAGRESVKDLDEKVITKQIIDLYESVLAKQRHGNLGRLEVDRKVARPFLQPPYSPKPAPRLVFQKRKIMKRSKVGIMALVLSVAGLIALNTHYFQAASLFTGNHSKLDVHDTRAILHPVQSPHTASESVSDVSLFAAHISSSPAATAPATGKEWYVSAEGKPNGEGTSESPWDLTTALAGGPTQTQVKPGDTIWLKGGRYTGAFVSKLAGKPDAPITVRQYTGQRAIIDRGEVSSAKQPALKVKGSWVWFRDFEIMNSNPDRTRNSPTTGLDEPWRGSGADVYSPNVKFINMVFHDNGHGIWDKQDMTEVYGCLFFYNGNNKREHALYIGNSNGTKYIVDNIVFAQGGYGILGFSQSSPQKGLHLEGNASFNNGILTFDDQTTGNIQVGGETGVAAERILVKNNYIYNPLDNAVSKNYGIRLGYKDTRNKDARLIDNYIVSKIPLRVWWWQKLESHGNTIYSQSNSVELRLPGGVSASNYQWDFNTYLNGRRGGPNFVRDDNIYGFSDWKQTTGLDRNSQMEQSVSLRPSGIKIFIRPNKYEHGRANIVVYNWDLRERVTVDVKSVLPMRVGYEVRDAQNYFGQPVACGTYDGRPISLPMNMTQVAQPVGNVERLPTHTAPEFAVFVLQPTGNPRCH